MIKKYEDLTLNDLKMYKCWVYDYTNRLVKPISDVLDFTTDTPYITYTKFELKNGSKYEGYMFAYDRSGSRLFVGESSVALSSTCYSTMEEALEFSKKVNLNYINVYPVQYESYIKCFGSNSGEIEIKA